MSNRTPPPHLSGAQIRAIIEEEAKRRALTFTATVEALAIEQGMGRSTLFDWLKRGLPRRQNSSLRSALIALANKDGWGIDGEQHGMD